MVQKYENKIFANSISNLKIRRVIVAVIVIIVCMCVSMIGLTNIIKYAYGYCGYLGLIAITIPALTIGHKKNKEYIAFVARDDSMLPLLGTEDTAIIEKCSSIKNNKIYLLINDDKLLIRKILILDNNEYELEPLNPYFPKEKATDLHIIGKVIRVEMKSAFL